MRSPILLCLLAGWLSLPVQASQVGLTFDRPAPARWSGQNGETADMTLLARKGEVSQGEAVRIAQRRYGGKAVKVERSGGVYYVRLLLPNGRVKQVVVDASSGRASD